MSEELLQMLCDKENKPNAFDEFLNSLEKVALEKEQPCLSCLLRRAGKLAKNVSSLDITDISNTRDAVSSDFQTPKRGFQIHRSAEYF